MGSAYSLYGAQHYLVPDRPGSKRQDKAVALFIDYTKEGSENVH